MKVLNNWQQYSKKYELDISKMSCSSEIAEFFREREIERYVYRIKYKGIVIKFGMSCPSAYSAREGDRLYRQIGHVHSWGNQRLTGSNGADFRVSMEDFENCYGFKLDHNFMSATVWDLTDCPFKTVKPDLEVKAIENWLIEEYVKIVGEKPIGNINDESQVKTQAAVPVQVLEKLFFEEI